jgi:hypothetical protein
MKSGRVLWLLPLLLVAPALADALAAKAKFIKRIRNSEEWVDIKSASFDDKFCFDVTGFASDGEHVVEVAVFDAAGREVSRGIKTVIAKGASWSYSFCPGITKDVDTPGEWWFVATLDDALVASASMMISYGAASAAPAAAAPAAPAPKPTRKEPPRYPRARQ